MIVDRMGRRFRNLRVSLTAACNYACGYCVPNGKRLLKTRDELPLAQLLQAVKLLQRVAGIDKLRITGGEPLVSARFQDFVFGVMALPFADVSVTTNGQLLLPQVPMLRQAGLQRINISLDTLDADRFRDIARSGDLASVLAAIDACLQAGISVKINMVPLRSGNLDQLVPMLDYALERGIELRYIELMRMGHLNHDARFGSDFLGMNELLEMIAAHYEYRRINAPFDSTAVRFEIPGKGVFGIIPNESEPFCANCTRLRLSANGWLYGCLSSTSRHYMADLLDLPEAEAAAQLAPVLQRSLADKQSRAFTGGATVMRFIGG